MTFTLTKKLQCKKSRPCKVWIGTRNYRSNIFTKHVNSIRQMYSSMIKLLQRLLIIIIWSLPLLVYCSGVTCSYNNLACITWISVTYCVIRNSRINIHDNVNSFTECILMYKCLRIRIYELIVVVSRNWVKCKSILNSYIFN